MTEDGATMRIEVNGEPREVPEGATVRDVVEQMGRDPSRPGVAVAVGGEIVPRADWGATRLHDGVHVEVVAAVQGG
jgi:sulfur carrier protein